MVVKKGFKDSVLSGVTNDQNMAANFGSSNSVNAAGNNASTLPFSSISASSLDLEGNEPVKTIQLEGLVVLKMLKHCQQSFPSHAKGHLLGLDINGVLEVSNCFGIPQEEQEFDDDEEYKNEMIRCLGDVNVDANWIGTYHSSFLGTFIHPSVVQHQYKLQKKTPQAVMLVYDLKSTVSNLSIKAYRLTSNFMALYKTKKFTTASLNSHKITFSKIFEELPVTIHNSMMVNLLLHDIEAYCPSPNPELLDLSLDPYLEKNMEGLQECLERYELDLNKHNGWERNFVKVKNMQNQFLQKKKAENVVRQVNNEELLSLPSEAELNQMFKVTPEASRLEPLLLQAQSYQYSKQITQFIGPSLTKLFFAGKLQQ